MVKFRALHTKTLDSFDFNDMPDDFTRLCWLLLPLISDREGRGILDYSWIRSRMYPLRTDIKLQKLEKSFNFLIERGMVTKYSVNNKNYFYITNWKEYQKGTEKEARSTLPTPENLPTNSGESPDLVTEKSASDSYAYTEAESYSNSDTEAGAEANAKTQKPPSPAFLSLSENQKLYVTITGIFPTAKQTEVIEHSISTLRKTNYFIDHPGELSDYLGEIFDEWVNSYNKNNVHYQASNPGWLDWALNKVVRWVEVNA